MGRKRKVPQSRQPKVESAPELLPVTTEEIGSFVQRIPAAFSHPQWATSQGWRNAVMQQPVMLACQGILIQQIISQPWLIVAKNTDETEKYKDEIEYYSDVLRKWGGEDFDTGVDRAGQDLLTIPFGCAVERGYYQDGTLAWIEPMDGATLYPTYDREYPVAQMVPGTTKAVAYPNETISRAYLSPRPEFNRKGWGMAPPEKAFLAALMLTQGDKFYWSMLIDSPEAGILDLADMKKESALEWIKNFRAMLGGIDPFKVPVLYEHAGEARFIPFKRGPVDLELTNAKGWYGALCSAVYGVPLGELGLSTNPTLAGAIREDRRGRRTGFGTMITKIENLINSLLPDYLRFYYENRDDEALALLGRARATNFTAFRQLIEAGVLTVEGARAQLRADGLISDVALTTLPPPVTTDSVGLRQDKRLDDRLVPPDEGGVGLVKKAIHALYPLVRQAHTILPMGEMANFAAHIKANILQPEDSGMILRSRSELLTEPYALFVAIDVMCSPWARKPIINSNGPVALKGTTVYHKIWSLYNATIE
jgi:hypothetical protein